MTVHIYVYTVYTYCIFIVASLVNLFLPLSLSTVDDVLSTIDFNEVLTNRNSPCQFVNSCPSIDFHSIYDDKVSLFYVGKKHVPSDTGSRRRVREEESTSISLSSGVNLLPVRSDGLQLSSMFWPYTRSSSSAAGVPDVQIGRAHV